MEFTFRGLMPPVFTPFNTDGSLNLAVIPKYAKYLHENSIKGILVNGTTGEGMSLNVAERKLLAEAWIQNAQPLGIHVMVQIGGASLPDVQELARHAESKKANSLLCLPNLYIKPQTSQDLIDYLKIVSAAAPKTPLLYYHIPMLTNVNLHMGDFLEDIKDMKVNTFVGIKFTSNDLAEGQQAVLANDKKYAVLLGADTLILPATTMDIDSFIVTTGNIFPKMANSSKTSPSDQAKLSSYVKCITKYGAWVPTMKAAMTLLTPIDCGPVRPPYKGLSAADLEKLKKDLSCIN